jgi:vitamin B12 transporter
MRLSLPIAACSTIFWCGGALADEPAPRPDAGIEAGTDETILVTGLRAPLGVDDVATSVTLFDKAAIDAGQSIAVSDLLARAPGVAFSRNGGIGTNTTVRIRGAESDQTVVVIDGVKLNDPSSAGGGFNFANLLVGDAARIELLRGPQSILWGSQAIGGVVNIVTEEPDALLEGSADLEAGSRETFYGRAGIGGASQRLSWRIAGSRFTTDGISAFARGTERDGYDNSSASGRLKLALVDGVSADLRGVYAKGRTEFDATSADTPEHTTSVEMVGYAGVNADLAGGRFRNRAAVTYTDIDRDSFNPARRVPRTFDAVGRNRRFEYQGSLTVAQSVDAVFGAETERSTMRTASPTLANPTPAAVRGRARIDGIYGQLRATPAEGLTLIGGLRHDDHDSYGSDLLAGASIVWSPNGGRTRLRANYGEGFKAPTLFQLYTEFGNRGLRPEKAEGWDIGVEQQLAGGALALSATYFERDSIDQIEFLSCPARTTEPLCFNGATRRSGYYDNIARTASRGIELAAAATVFGQLTLDANYSWLDAENRSPGANLGNALQRRPRHAANASATYAWRFGLRTSVALRYAGRSFDNASNSVRLDDYTLVDLRASVPLNKTFEGFARIENLFDEDYETIRNYGTLGRSIHAGVRARF